MRNCYALRMGVVIPHRLVHKKVLIKFGLSELFLCTSLYKNIQEYTVPCPTISIVCIKDVWPMFFAI